MLGHRLRPWPNIETTLGQCLVFAGHGIYNPCHALLSVTILNYFEAEILLANEIGLLPVKT